jgi:hypothetical protein
MCTELYESTELNWTLADFHANKTNRSRERYRYLREDPMNSNSNVATGLENIGSFTSFPPNRDNTFRPAITLFFARILLAAGIGLSAVGYVGCFNIVQQSSNALGPLVWLIVEAGLSILRLIIWAVNPIRDDPPPPIVISSTNAEVTYTIGWGLEDVLAKDVHAVIIDIPNQITVTPENGWPMFSYLTKRLAVPEDQVAHLIGSGAEAIEDALVSLAKNTDIRRGSPVIIYISHRSGKPEDTTCPERIGADDSGMLYSKFFTLVGRISEKKGENVVSYHRVDGNEWLLIQFRS